ncbi:MAG: hypothetical protein CVV30_06290 [Methanomicrobiales archaeon HGW-Methanomicrobiales-1]|jgi:uncharacterized ferredoxin-like protein|nr:MAG: hypothetical protein CVV30_06290 [Methanomicrobiales archaeon HGW-Methanomicrobiales-1]
MTGESDAVKTVAGLMALSARTAPKAVGLDSIHIEILTGKEQEKLGNQMIKVGKEIKMDFFWINGEQVKVSDVTLLIGVEGRKGLGINCGGCGHATCAEMAKAVKAGKNAKALYPGPNCVMKITDLGIAVGSAVKTASIHNVDNRVMFSAGVIALQQGLLKGCSVAYGIPLKASGKNIFWDTKFAGH